MSINIACDVVHLNGVAKCKVAARCEDRLIHPDRIDLTSAQSRRRFCTDTAKKVIDPSGGNTAALIAACAADVELLLLGKLDELERSRPPDAAAAPAGEP